MCFAGMKRVAQYASTDRSCVKENEVFVFADVGRAIRVFLFNSYLCISNVGRVSSGTVSTWRMGGYRAGDHRFSDQHHHCAVVSSRYA